MIANILRLLILIFLINIIFGFYLTPNNNQHVNPVLLNQRSSENDNEYVWFTRDISNDNKIKQSQLWKQQNLLYSKMFNRKYPFIEHPVYETE